MADICALEAWFTSVNEALDAAERLLDRSRGPLGTAAAYGEALAALVRARAMIARLRSDPAIFPSTMD